MQYGLYQKVLSVSTVLSFVGLPGCSGQPPTAQLRWVRLDGEMDVSFTLGRGLVGCHVSRTWSRD